MCQARDWIEKGRIKHAVADIRIDVYTHMQELPLSFYAERRTGDPHAHRNGDPHAHAYANSDGNFYEHPNPDQHTAADGGGTALFHGKLEWTDCFAELGDSRRN